MAEGFIPLGGSRGHVPPGNFEKSLIRIFCHSGKRSDRFKTAIYLFISLVFEVKTAIMPYLVADVKLVLS